MESAWNVKKAPGEGSLRLAELAWATPPPRPPDRPPGDRDGDGAERDLRGDRAPLQPAHDRHRPRDLLRRDRLQQRDRAAPALQGLAG